MRLGFLLLAVTGCRYFLPALVLDAAPARDAGSLLYFATPPYFEDVFVWGPLGCANGARPAVEWRDLFDGGGVTRKTSKADAGRTCIRDRDGGVLGCYAQGGWFLICDARPDAGR